MAFVPEDNSKQQPVPYLEEVSSMGGWAGHTTTKSIESLIAEISTVLDRLGATLTNRPMSGTFEDELNPNRKRPGYVFRFTYETPDGKSLAGKLEVAGLPLRKPNPEKEKQSRKMALYMLRESLEGMWYMQQLSPGLVALVPFMLTDNDQTFSQQFSSRMLLPAPESAQEDVPVDDEKIIEV